ncbi:PREDICTED: membrane cofactor protein-like [Miniopterus natalensis]|uniref:membrane cofactor protein-like n=1 Tax=Miniopterus natalensis TaxID=291302 RepID=UPI0007A6B36D|nr:PREDICTED: membrane cofactor protein-like [Miniopterus natalensis]
MLPKGNITPPYNIGVEIHYECIPGYVPKDPLLPIRIVCDKNATWTNITEACKHGYCGDPPKFRTMVSKTNHSPPYNIGVEIDYQCILGYVPRYPPRPTKIVCENNATWTNITEACTNVCDDPPNFHFMRPKGNVTPPYNFGVEIDYECRPGHEPKDVHLPTRIVCQRNATWTEIMEACKKKTCQKLGILVNGQIIFSDGTNEYGTRAQYVCFDG